MNFYPKIDELSEEDIDRLRAVTAKNLRIKVRYQYSDDQAQCVDVEINGVKIALKWIGDYAAAALYFYKDSPSAKEEALAGVRWVIERWEKDRGEGNEDE
jgi:hypothetical protein